MDGVEHRGAAGAEPPDIGAVAAPGRERRMTTGHSRDSVLRYLRGKPLGIVERSMGTAPDLNCWLDAFLEVDAASL